VAPLFDDDLLDTGVTFIDGWPAVQGVYEPVYVGDVEVDGQSWRELLVAGCAIADIRKAYLSDWPLGSGLVEEQDLTLETDFLWPGSVGWQTRFGADYRDIVGTDGVTRGAPSSTPAPKGDAIAAGPRPDSVDGIEDVGSGRSIITDLYQQALHVLNHLIHSPILFVDPPPMFADTLVCQVHRPSFGALQCSAAELAAGTWPRLSWGGWRMCCGADVARTAAVLGAIPAGAEPLLATDGVGHRCGC
jgi:hypothetical protein